MEPCNDRRALLQKSSVQSLSMRSMSDLIECSDTVVRKRLRSQSVPVNFSAFHRCIVCLVEEGAKIAHSTQGKERLGSPVIVIAPEELEEEARECGRHQLEVDHSQSMPTVLRDRAAPSQKKRTMIQRGKHTPALEEACETSQDATATQAKHPGGGLMSLEDVMASGALNKGANVCEENEKQVEEDIMENCSLMEYPTTITAESPLAALLKIQEVSDEFERKIGGIVTVASKDTPITKGIEDGTFCVTVKWALPVLNFENSQTDPNEVAAWLLQAVPPCDSEAMGSKKGVFMDVDRSVLRRILRDAITLQR